MRLRNVRGAREMMEEHPDWIVMDPLPLRGRWKELFGNDQPIHLEIGMGKGQFVLGMARQTPGINYLGMERFDSVAVRALQRLLAEPLPNVRMIRANAEHLEAMFEPGEIQRIHLNFSDPWPRKAHAKRRLTHINFLNRYRAILAPGSEIHFKTDNRGLFEFTLEHFNAHGMHFEEVCLDLHAQEPEDNVRTEYEETWSAKGSKIYRLVSRFPGDEPT